MFNETDIDSIIAELIEDYKPLKFDGFGLAIRTNVFNRLQGGVASLFLTQPSSIYGLAYMISRHAQLAFNELGGQLDKSLAYVSVLRKRSIPVKDVSSLNNAKTALIELENVLGRSGSTKDVTNVSAYRRLNTNLDRFLQLVKSNVRHKGELVPTHVEARHKLPVLAKEILAGVAKIKTRLELLSNLVVEYRKLNLLSKTLLTIVANSRRLLSETTKELDGMSETDRVRILREVVLKVISIKSVVNKFASVSSLADVQATGGMCEPYADEGHKAEAAEAICLAGPYVLIPGNSIKNSTNVLPVALDTSVTQLFNSSVTVGVAAPYATFTRTSGSFITDGVSTGQYVLVTTGPDSSEMFFITNVTNLVLTCTGPTPTVGVHNIKVVKVTDLVYLPTSKYASIESLVSEPYVITSSVNDSLRFEVNGVGVSVSLTSGTRTATNIATDITAALTPHNFKGEVFFAPLKFSGDVNTAGNILTLPYGNFLGTIEVGDEVLFTFGPNVGITRTITIISGPTITVGGAPLVTGVDKVEVGPTTKRVRIVPINKLTAVSGYTKLKLVTDTTLRRDSAITFGLYTDLLAECEPTNASSIVSFLKANTNVAADVLLIDADSNVKFKTSPASTDKLIVYVAILNGTWTGGTSITITTSSTSTILVGQKVLLNGLVGTITAKTSTTLSVTFISTIASGMGIFEVRPSTTYTKGLVFRCESGPNDGAYYVREVSALPGELSVTPNFPISRSSYGVGEEMLGRISSEVLIVKSKNTTLNSRVQIWGNTNTFVSSIDNGNLRGKTKYFKVPASVGDLVQLFRTNAEFASFSGRVASYEDGIADLGLTYYSDISYTVSSPGSVVPYAVVRLNGGYDFKTMSESIQLVLSADPFASLTKFKNELYRRLNPLIANENPTDADCAAVESHINTLVSAMATVNTAIQAYSVDVHPELTTVLRSVTEQGADRGFDLLMEGRLSEFFNLSQTSASYGGHLQQAIRDIALNDLPIEKTNREDARKIRASYEDTDYEYSTEDATYKQVNPEK